jgi:pyruvate dehydrogenase E2 component (dihydrolipoamide acetyltransferase)
MAEIVTMPKLGFDMAEGTLVRWVKNEGEKIEKGAILAEIETDKATVEVESTFSGIIHKFLVEQGSSVPVGTPIAIIASEGEKVNENDLVLIKKEQPSPKEDIPTEVRETQKVSMAKQPDVSSVLRASPLARKMASDAGLDLKLITGSGPDGRIVKKDIEKTLLSGKKQSVSTSKPPLESNTLPSRPSIQWDFPRPGDDQKSPIDKLRAAIGRRMTESKQQLPHFYVTHEYDVERLLSIRKDANELLNEDAKLSVNDFVIKAVALTLRQFPNLNASLKGEQIIHYGYVNIGVAVSLPGGLLTVVCKDADQKSVQLISNEVKEMVNRARSGKVKPDDIEGSTFSISNLGMYDVNEFAAIINPPEAAILAVGSAKEVPVIKNGMITIGTRMKATVSVDHRVSDGVEAAKFLQVLGEYLEHPLGFFIT